MQPDDTLLTERPVRIRPVCRFCRCVYRRPVGIVRVPGACSTVCSQGLEAELAPVSVDREAVAA